jgi:hypothetical protein
MEHKDMLATYATVILPWWLFVYISESDSYLEREVGKHPTVGSS